jgi:hypothetical protein
MMSLKKLFNITLLITAYILFVLKSSFAAEIKSKCEDVIRNIENITDIPSGLLLGIGKAESGRILKNNEIVIWPWTINHAGKSLFFDNKSQMKLYLLKHTKKGDNNLDVGCMQINLKWHKQNFKDIKDMLAIEPNISYAASFLVQLKNKHGSWEKAIKHYHSSDPIKNKPYLNKVLSFWQSYKKNSIQIADNKTKINLNSSNTNNISESIKDTQPYLFARIDKVNFFRKIFQEK